MPTVKVSVTEKLFANPQFSRRSPNVSENEEEGENIGAGIPEAASLSPLSSQLSPSSSLRSRRPLVRRASSGSNRRRSR